MVGGVGDVPRVTTVTSMVSSFSELFVSVSVSWDDDSVSFILSGTGSGFVDLSILSIRFFIIRAVASLLFM